MLDLVFFMYFESYNGVENIVSDIRSNDWLHISYHFAPLNNVFVQNFDKVVVDTLLSYWIVLIVLFLIPSAF